MIALNKDNINQVIKTFPLTSACAGGESVRIVNTYHKRGTEKHVIVFFGPLDLDYINLWSMAFLLLKIFALLHVPLGTSNHGTIL